MQWEIVERLGQVKNEPKDTGSTSGKSGVFMFLSIHKFYQVSLGSGSSFP